MSDSHEYKCTRCGTKKSLTKQPHGDRPPGWARWVILRDNQKVEFMLCSRCDDAVSHATNKASEALGDVK